MHVLFVVFFSTPALMCIFIFFNFSPLTNSGARKLLIMSFFAAVDCGPLDDPENGTVFHFSTTFGSPAFYSCFNGFVLVGSSVRTCLSFGNWSGSAPTCQGKT